MSEDAGQVTLELKGKRITAARFRHAVDSFFAMMDEVTEQVAGKGKAVSWVITVKPGSAIIEATPEATSPEYADVGLRVLRAVQEGTAALERHASVPQFFTEAAIQKFSDLASVVDVTGNDIAAVNLRFDGAEPVALTSAAMTNVQVLLEPNVHSYGTIEGKLQTLTNRRAWKFYVYEDLTDRRVECFFPSEMADTIETGWRKRVSVSGVISYRKTGTPVNIRVDAFRILGKGPLPTWNDMRGILA